MERGDNSWDQLIHGATVYDGTGDEPKKVDVAITNDRITAVGNLQGHAGKIIDAQGLALAPGFIDVHSHDDFAVLLHPEMDFKVMQGVTTDVVGNCGLGAAPFTVAYHDLRLMHPQCKLPNWPNYDHYFRAIEQEPPSLNVAVLVGHGTLRRSCMSNSSNHKPSSAEQKQMCVQLLQALEAGAVGFSSGLIYDPGRYANTEELIALAQAMATCGGLYTTHMRNEADRLLEAATEAIRIGEEGGVAVQISHHKAAGRQNWGKVKESLQLIEEAREQGLDVSADQYPYTSASTILSAVLENGALGQGNSGGVGHVDAADVLLASLNQQHQFQGMTLQQLCDEWNLEPEAAARKILQKDDPFVILNIMNEEDVCCVLQHPTTMIGSDGVPSDSGNPHPRLYGTFARILGHYVRDKKLLSLPQAIHRMTGFPATKFKLKDRGFIRPGAYADLVLFDPNTIADVATFTHSRCHPQGIQGVWVNGTAVVSNGQHTNNRPGRALRSAH